MRSFAAIATIATLAFSAVASALPAYGPAGHHDGHDGDHHEPGTGVSVPHPPVDVPHPPHTGDSHPHYGRDIVVSIPELFVNVNVDVGTKCHDLGDEIKKAGDTKAAVDVAVKVLADVQAIIKDLEVKVVAAVDVALNAHVDANLNLNGKLLDVHAMAQIVANLMISVYAVVGILVDVCVNADIKAVLDVVANISVSIVAIIQALIKLSVCADIAVDIKALVQVCVKVIVDLKLTALIQVLGL